MAEALTFERQWREMSASTAGTTLAGTDLVVYNQLRALYQHVHAMRVVPFDLRSFSELVGYATGPFLPLLTLVERLESPPITWLIDHLFGE